MSEKQTTTYTINRAGKPGPVDVLGTIEATSLDEAYKKAKQKWGLSGDEYFEIGEDFL